MTDTARKRRSSIPGTLPEPDGTIDAGDRGASLGVYDPTGSGGGGGGGGDEDDLVEDTGTAFLVLDNIRVKVDVKISRDRGSGTSSASGPVTVNFNKTFADIRNLDVFPIQNSGAKIYRVIDFVDAPDPTSFNVEFYNSAGTRLALDFGWEASGVLKF